MPDEMTTDRPAARRGGDTRRQIVLSSIELFATKGYDNTSLDDIANAVGIRKPSLYHYIRTKEDLLFEIDDLLVDELQAEATRLAGEATTPEEKVRAVFRAGMHLVANRQQELTIFLSERHGLDSTDARWLAIAEKRAAYQTFFQGILEEGMRTKVFRRLPPTLTANALLGSLSWAYRWYRPEGPATTDEIADLFSDIVLNGIAAG